MTRFSKKNQTLFTSFSTLTEPYDVIDAFFVSTTPPTRHHVPYYTCLLENVMEPLPRISHPISENGLISNTIAPRLLHDGLQLAWSIPGWVLEISRDFKRSPDPTVVEDKYLPMMSARYCITSLPLSSPEHCALPPSPPEVFLILSECQSSYILRYAISAEGSRNASTCLYARQCCPFANR